MRTAAEYREDRRRLGLVSLLDQFLETRHPLPQRQAIAAELGITTTALEALIAGGSSDDPRRSLHSRLTLNLQMAGVGKKEPR